MTKLAEVSSPSFLDADYIGLERAKIIKGNQKVTTLDEKAIQEAVARFDALVKDGKATVSIFKVSGCSCE